MYSLLIAFNSNDVENFLDNFRFEVTGQDANGRDIYERVRTDFTPFQDHTDNPQTWDLYNRDHFFLVEDGYGLWKEATSGPNTTIVVPCYVNRHAELDYTDPQDPDPGTILTIVHYLRDVYPGRSQILGVWDENGVPAGQTWVPPVYDENGDVVTPGYLTGNKYYPEHPQILNWMPDDVTYDDNGNETSRTPASAPKEVHKLLGWEDRLWD